MNTRTLIATSALVASLSFTAGAATVSDFTELSFAIANANEGDTITLDDKTFDVTAKIEITTAGLTIVGAGKGKTILDCGSTAEPARSNAVFYVHAPNVKISGLTIQNAADFEGNPAVYVSSGNNAMSGFEISDCEFVNCHGSHAGGMGSSLGDVGSDGIAARANYPIITGCEFRSCGSHAAEAQGGAVCGSFWIENSTFDACTREAWSIVMLHSSSVVSNCVFSNMGKAETEISNGLVCMSQSDGRAHLLVEDCVFASIGEGPLVGQAYSVIDRCVISNCYATAAAKYNERVATNAIVAVNGISTRPWVNNRGTPECRNTLFVDNKLPIQLEGSDMYVNCTFVNNVGGLFCKADQEQAPITASLVNCVFWGNSEWKCEGAHVEEGGYGITFHYSGLPTGVQISNCVFEHASENAGLMAAANVDTTGVSSNLSCRADAEGVKFNDYANGDFSPAADSVLVTNGVVLSWMTDATDLAGRPRLSQNLVDIGCYQSDPNAEGPVDPTEPLSPGYKPSISGFDNGSDGIKITIDNALVGHTYGYKKSTTLEGLKDPELPILYMENPVATAGELLFTIERDPNEPTCFYQIVVK